MLCRRGMASGAFAPAGLVRQGRGRLILKIDICKLLPVIVAHDIAGVQFLDKPGRREKRRAGIKPSSGHNMRNCLVVRRVGEWENDNETSCPFDCALSYSGSGRQYDCASVLSSPASSLLASWRWRLLLELLSDLLAGGGVTTRGQLVERHLRDAQI